MVKVAGRRAVSFIFTRFAVFIEVAHLIVVNAGVVIADELTLY